jgi:hypothetical protein
MNGKHLSTEMFHVERFPRQLVKCSTWNIADHLRELGGLAKCSHVKRWREMP